MSRREWLAWVAAAFIGIEAGRFATSAATGATEVPFNAMRLIAWGCVVLLLRRPAAAAPPSAGWRLWTQLTCGLAALLLPVDRAIFNLLCWSLLTGAGVLVLAGKGWESAERRAAAVMLAIATQGFSAKWAAILLESPILSFDTALAGVVMQWVTPGSTWAGHSLRPPGGVGVTLYLACSSFANLSLVWLCFASLAALDGVWRAGRAAAAVAGVSLVVFAANTLRIVLMAQSLRMYEYWHYGPGGQMLALALSATTVALCSLGSRWAAAR